jgi:hypothetical protein
MEGRVVCANGHPNDGIGEEMRFCLQCGAPLELRCSNGHVSPMGRRFCPACGEPLFSVDTYSPPARPASIQPPQTGGPPPPTRERRRAPVLLLVIGIVVVAGAAAGAVLVLHNNSAGSNPNKVAVGRTSSTVEVSTATHNTTASTASTVPATTLPTSTVPPPTTTLPANLVTVNTSEVASNALSPDVAQTFATYFGGINDRKWAQAYGAYSPGYQQDVSLASFESVDGTSSDENIVVTSIDEGTGGTLSVGVDFTSHQAAANGPSGETCTQWTLTYVLVPSPGGDALDYLIRSAKGSDSSCPT